MSTWMVEILWWGCLHQIMTLRCKRMGCFRERSIYHSVNHNPSPTPAFCTFLSRLSALIRQSLSQQRTISGRNLLLMRIIGSGGISLTSKWTTWRSSPLCSRSGSSPIIYLSSFSCDYSARGSSSSYSACPISRLLFSKSRSHHVDGFVWVWRRFQI